MKPIHKKSFVDLATLAIKVKHFRGCNWRSYTNGMVTSSLALPTSFRTASFKSALGKCFLSAEGRDSK